MTFRDVYVKMNTQVVPGPALVERVLAAMETEGAGRVRRFKRKTGGARVRKPILLAAALAVLLLSTMSVLAATVERANDLMYMLSPATAQFLKPIQKSCEDNGIRMELVGTYIHDDKAEIYLALQDISGNRVDETTDLNDSYSLRKGFEGSETAENVGYDEATKTATFLVTITKWDGRIEGSKLTFSLRSFLSRKQVERNQAVAVVLPTEQGDPQTKSVELNGGGGFAGFDTEKLDDGDIVLNSPGVIARLAEWIDITGVGYINGKLHVQSVKHNVLQNDNHADLYLKDSKGTVTRALYSVGFIEENHNTGALSDAEYYDEDIFDVGPEEAADYRLFGDFYTSGMYTEGNWDITFPVD